MSATITISRRNRSIALTLSLPAAAICAGVAGTLSVRHHASDVSPAHAGPVITLVQPRGGGIVLQDRPVVMFRFSGDHPGDPIDAASFHVALDGEDRTEGFQLSASEAWGSLSGRDGAAGITSGVHTIHARICSVRGICATLESAIVVRPANGVIVSSLRVDDAEPDARLIGRSARARPSAPRRRVRPVGAAGTLKRAPMTRAGGSSRSN